MKKRSVLTCMGGGGRSFKAIFGFTMASSVCHPEALNETVRMNCSDSGSHRNSEIPNSIVEHNTQRGMFRDDTRGQAGSITGQRAIGRRLPLKNLTSYRLNDLTSIPAFTMAEILLSLTIIGVVAAITLPSLTGNINERTWNTQRKALYARFSQTIALMPALNGYGTLTEDGDGNVTADTAAETFVTEGLSKVIKINNICDSEHYADCGFPTTFTTMLNPTVKDTSDILTLSGLNPQLTSVSYSAYNTTAASSYSTLDTKAAAFETQNGESILLHYNPKCVAGMNETLTYFSQPGICANMIYDLNGSKGPNTIGKDMGILTILYSTDSSVVAPMPYNKIIGKFVSTEASRACTNEVGDEYRLPTKDELASLFVNKDILGVEKGDVWYSSSKAFAKQNWVLEGSLGEYRIPAIVGEWYSFCIKR